MSRRLLAQQKCDFLPDKEEDTVSSPADNGVEEREAQRPPSFFTGTSRFFPTTTAARVELGTGFLAAAGKTPPSSVSRRLTTLKPPTVVPPPLLHNSKQALSFVYSDKRRPNVRTWIYPKLSSAGILSTAGSDKSTRRPPSTSLVTVELPSENSNIHHSFKHKGPAPNSLSKNQRLAAIVAARAASAAAASTAPVTATKCMQTGVAELYPELTHNERRLIRERPANQVSQNSTLDEIFGIFSHAFQIGDKAAQQEALDMLSGRMKFKCLYCEKICLSERYIRRHIRLHTDVMGHDCEICSAHYATRDELRMHQRVVHEGECNFRCNACNYVFVRASYLKTHLRTQAHKDVVDGKCSAKPQVFRDGLPMHSQKLNEQRKQYTKKFDKIPPGEPEWDVILPQELQQALNGQHSELVRVAAQPNAEAQQMIGVAVENDAEGSEMARVTAACDSRMLALREAAKLISAPERRRTHNEEGKINRRGPRNEYARLQQVRKIPVKIYRYNYCNICEKFVDNITNPAAMQQHEQHLAGHVTTLAKCTANNVVADRNSSEQTIDNGVENDLILTNSADSVTGDAIIRTENDVGRANSSNLTYWKDINVDLVVPYYWQANKTLDYVYNKEPTFLRATKLIKKPENDVETDEDEEDERKRRRPRRRGRYGMPLKDDDAEKKLQKETILENMDFTDPDLLSYVNFDSSLKLSKHITHRHRKMYYNSGSNPVSHTVAGVKRNVQHVQPSAILGNSIRTNVGGDDNSSENFAGNGEENDNSNEADELDGDDDANYVRIRSDKWQQALRLLGEQKLKIKRLEMQQQDGGKGEEENVLRRSARKRRPPARHGEQNSSEGEEESESGAKKPSRFAAVQQPSQTINISSANVYQPASSASSSMYVRADRPEQVQKLLQQGWTISGLLPRGAQQPEAVQLNQPFNNYTQH